MKKMPSLKFTLLAVFAGLFMTVSAQAATYTVNSNTDAGDGTCDATCTLRDAVTAANNNPANDIIEFDAAVFAAPQTIALGGTRLLINNNGTLTINGTGAERLTVSGSNLSRVFSNAGATVTINALTIANGNAGAQLLGGGIYNLGNLTINNVTIRNNTSSNGGGGIRSDSGSTIIVIDSTISNNSSSRGGGIDTNGNVSLTLTNSTISGNTASVASGGIANTGTLTANNSIISNNSATGFGGGIGNFGTAALNNSIISNNTANNGGGVGNTGSGGKVTLTNSTVRGNSTVAGSPATNAGGGLYNINGGTLTFNNSTVSGNSTTNTGAGIYNRSSLTMNNSTVSGNTGANFGGGGIRVEAGGTATINSSTVSDNSSTGFGGGISVVDAGSNATLDNTIIANSPAGGDCFSSFGGIINASYTLIEQNLNCVNGMNSNNLTGDPQLGPLANNGGSTETHALLAFSPAIDKGYSTLPTDQRGFPRPVDLPSYQNAVNGSDIGAFELQQEYDRDGDGVSDNIDNCLNTANADQGNFDGDAQGNACDADDDNDSVNDDVDAFPFDPNESVDTDGDGIGNNADTDDDGDGQTDASETACGSNPLDAASKSADADGDNSPDCVDTDDDNDNIPDTCDVDQNPGAMDFDRDGIVDSSQCDTLIGPPVDKDQCKNGGWMRFNNPTFRNQGQCIQFVNTGK